MAGGKELRRLALSLQGATEAPHFDRAAFRVAREVDGAIVITQLRSRPHFAESVALSSKLTRVACASARRSVSATTGFRPPRDPSPMLRCGARDHAAGCASSRACRGYRHP